MKRNNQSKKERITVTNKNGYKRSRRTDEDITDTTKMTERERKKGKKERQEDRKKRRKTSGFIRSGKVEIFLCEVPPLPVTVILSLQLDQN